eukprot:CAMPEP_0184694922 /NCGR_PEP_ID=MMETSP0313-20130426/2721_1 /TAXON_ID=2792 /ORGANISM="Porphyridium aerugineum, Strain SAG 1380-2" /LENGTH=405 /DNA_ID=CAMNT_0027153287 /DNA_START=63 /DNA_END=1283 /DNA_ORIENTATION=-
MSMRYVWLRLAAYGAAGLSALGVVTGKLSPNFFDGPLADITRAILDGETAHDVSITAAKYSLFGFGQADRHSVDDPSLKTVVFGRTFRNPVGLAAGFDKDAVAVPGLVKTGFGFVEVGTITPLPQPGNPKPRAFRLVEDKAIINRYGFNSKGMEFARKQLEEVAASPPQGLVGVNVGKNKTTSAEDAKFDYEKVIRQVVHVSDYIVVNVSSPNTPGLRDLQKESELRDLLNHVIHVRNEAYAKAKPDVHVTKENVPPLLLKIAPDLSESDKKSIAKVALEVGVDGLVVSNTTIQRPSTLKSAKEICQETGGLSGAPLFEMSTQMVGEMYQLTHGRIPIIGVGGISNGEQAYRKIRQGASLVQLYTAIAYQGPLVVEKIKKELSECLKRDGFHHISEAVGADFKKK